MGSRKSIGDLHATVSADATKFMAEFNRADRLAARVGKSIAEAVKGPIAGALSAGAITSFTKGVIDMGGQIKDLSVAAGLSTDAFQTLTLAGMESGVTMEMTAKAAEHFRNKLQAAAEGNKEAAASFARLGLSAAGLQALAPEKQWEVLARSIVNAKNQQEAMNAASDIFGEKVGPKLRQLLQQLAGEGFDKLADSVKGLRLTAEQIKTLDDAGDALERIWTKIKLIGAQPIALGLQLSDPTATATGIPRLVALQQEAQKMLAGQGGLLATDARLAVENYSELVLQLKDVGNAYAALEMYDQLPGAKTDYMQAQVAALKDLIAAQQKHTEALKADDAATQEIMMHAEAVAALEARKAKALEETLKDKGLAAEVDKAIADGQRAIAQEAEQEAAALERLAEQIRHTADPSLKFKEQIEQINYALSKSPELAEDAAKAIAAITREMNEDAERRAKAAAPVKMEEVVRETEKASKAAQELGWAFQSAFEDAIIEGEKFSDVLRGLAKDIQRIILRETVTGPIGDWFKDIFKGKTIFDLFRAEGGPVSAGKPYVVGEEGPELFMPSASGTIIPNNKLSGMGGGGRAGVVIEYIDARGADRAGMDNLLRYIQSVQRSIPQVAIGAVAEANQRSMRFRGRMV